jgi:hypothetical protein
VHGIGTFQTGSGSGGFATSGLRLPVEGFYSFLLLVSGIRLPVPRVAAAGRKGAAGEPDAPEARSQPPWLNRKWTGSTGLNRFAPADLLEMLHSSGLSRFAPLDLIQTWHIATPREPLAETCLTEVPLPV